MAVLNGERMHDTMERLLPGARSAALLWQGAAVLGGAARGAGQVYGGAAPFGLALVIGCPPSYCLAAALGTLAAVALRPSPDTVPASTAAEPRTMLVLDAGHGGEDGGAVSDSGVAESGINLQITRRLYEILRFLGHPAVMPRTGDEAIYDDAAATLREKKVSDLKNRTKLANETAGGLLISIHQNCLPGYPNVRGAQVFYNAVLPSRQLAEAMQQTLNTAVNTDRAKAAMPIGDGVYLMTHTTCPAILVECGFLSSPQETALLQQPSYQMKIAAVIAAGYCQYCTSEGTT